jgi:glutaredoxin-like YruB-family protein
MNVKNINTLEALKKVLSKNTTSFLLLYKSGSEQSDCAIKNLGKVNIESVNVYSADVSMVRDIHPEYSIKSVPSFLEFSGNKLNNVYKGCHETEFFNNLIIGAVYTTNSASDKPQKRVTVYSTPSCSWCTRLKTYLDSKGIKYRDIDISKDQKIADDLVKRSGQQGVPQTEINGKIIVGFDQGKIDSMLGI